MSHGVTAISSGTRPIAITARKADQTDWSNRLCEKTMLVWSRAWSKVGHVGLGNGVFARSALEMVRKEED